MPIYTRKGDAGQTGLSTGERVSKTNPRIEAVGTIDELNSALGIALASLPALSDIRKEVIPIQHELFALGAYVATPSGSPSPVAMIPDASIERLEQAIDRWWNQMPELKNFILPGGTAAAAQLHVARSITRRAERRVILLVSVEETIDPMVVRYLNRLSDFLFAAARFANYEAHQTDILWQK